MANQFTEGTREGHPEEVRQKIRVGNIIARLEKIIEESDQESSIIAASKVLIDKSLPSLSSVDQTNYDGESSPETVEAKLEAIIRAKPDLLQRILGRLAQEQQHAPKALEADTNVGTQPKTGTDEA